MAGLGPRRLDRLRSERVGAQAPDNRSPDPTSTPAHDAGRWRGPSERVWLERIVRGAGYGLAPWSAATARPTHAEAHRGEKAPTPADRPAAD
jgi:hypothetical protein